MRYRAATLEDIPVICRLGEEVNAIHHEAYPHVFAAPGVALRDADHWRQSIAGEANATIVAEDVEVVGFITVSIHVESNTLLQPARVGKVGSVCITANYRSRGVGRQLMALAEDWVVQRGGSEIRLNVWAFNARAVAFYDELGYEVRSYQMAKRAEREA